MVVHVPCRRWDLIYLTGWYLVPVDVRGGSRSCTTRNDALIEGLLARILGTEILLARPPHVLLAARTCGSSCESASLRLQNVRRR